MSRKYVTALEFLDEMNEKAAQMVSGMDGFKATSLGLDPRSFYGMAFVDESVIVVGKDQDRTLQYYGGFEYVDKDCRREVGDYVFYLADDERVLGCIEYALNRPETEQNEEKSDAY